MEKSAQPSHLVEITAPKGEMFRVSDMDVNKLSDLEAEKCRAVINKHLCQQLTTPEDVKSAVGKLLKEEAIAQIAAQRARKLRTIIGKMIAREREARGWSYADLCVRTGLHRHTILNLEDGNKTPSDLTLMRVFRAFGWHYQAMPNLTNSYPVNAWYAARANISADTVDLFSW